MTTMSMGLTVVSTSGLASYYGGRFAGKKTANGEIFNPRAMTCASPVYSFNTILSVYYPKSNRTVLVRVNDRGPNIKGRILDLSERAAEELGLKKYGVGYVIITPIRFEHTYSTGKQ